MAARAASSKLSVWFRDPSTYPLLACIGAGSIMCATVGIRHLTSSPDVKWNRVVRKNSQLQYTDTSGSWFSHRKPLSEMHENPVNTAYKK